MVRELWEIHLEVQGCWEALPEVRTGWVPLPEERDGSLSPPGDQGWEGFGVPSVGLAWLVSSYRWSRMVR